MLLWTWEYRCHFKTVISFCLVIYPEVGLLDHMILLFSVSWGTSILFFVVASQVYISQQQCTNVAFSLHSHQHCYLFIIAILTGLCWCLVLICFSLIISDVEHLFMYVLTVCMSSLEQYLFKSFAHFNWVVCAFANK